MKGPILAGIVFILAACGLTSLLNAATDRSNKIDQLAQSQVTIQQEAEAIQAQARAIEEQSRTIGSQADNAVSLTEEVALAYRTSLAAVVSVAVLAIIGMLLVASSIGRRRAQ